MNYWNTTDPAYAKSRWGRLVRAFRMGVFDLTYGRDMRIALGRITRILDTTTNAPSHRVDLALLETDRRNHEERLQHWETAHNGLNARVTKLEQKEFDRAK